MALIRLICVLLFLAVVCVGLYYRVHKMLFNGFLDILGLEPKGAKEIRMDRLQSNIDEAVISPSQL